MHTRNLKNLIREIKSAVRQGMAYYEASASSRSGEHYLDETLILEHGKILYYAKRMGNDEIQEGGSVIYTNAEAFLKTPIDEIVKVINAAYYYNVYYNVQ